MNDPRPSVGFDRAADSYDQTRDLPGPMATEGIEAIRRLLQAGRGAAARILDVGTGTGRIAVPLRARGVDVIGCDLSSRMLARQRVKAPAARLVQASAAALPFGSAVFDAALTIHVLHLLGDWRGALAELRRVLRPGGVYVNSSDARQDGVDAEMRAFWRERVEAHGGDWRRPGVDSREELWHELQAQGARVEARTVATFAQMVTPQSVLDGIAARVCSDTWNLSERVLRESLDDLRDWAMTAQGDLTAPRPVQRRFVLDVVRFVGR